MQFLSDLDIIAIADRPGLWRLGAPLVWGSLDGLITVPKGFITDLASIPYALRFAPRLDPNGLSRRPAVVHDWLYSTGGGHRGKAYADDTLKAALIAEGAGAEVAQIYYDAVHWFGESSYLGDHAKLTQANFYTPDDFRAWVGVDSL